MSDQVRDMTKGSPAKLILLFAVPLMLGNIFQQLYTMVDTIVVGQVAGVQALAALGAVEWIMWMVLGVSTGSHSIMVPGNGVISRKQLHTVICLQRSLLFRFWLPVSLLPDGSWCF